MDQDGRISPPEGSLEHWLEVAEDGLLRAGEVPPVRLADRQLRDALGTTAALRAATDRLTVRLIAEAIARGETVAGGFRLVDWIVRTCPGTARSHAIDLARIAAALASDSVAEAAAHQPIDEALGSGDLSVRRASMVLRALERIRPVVDDEGYAADAVILLDAARQPLFTEADLARITDRLIAAALPEAQHVMRDRSAREARSVSESSLADGSLTRFLIVADSEGASALRSVMTSPLAAPTPDVDGLPDRRTPAQRRYDALMMMVGRGVAAPEGQPTTAKAQIIVTMPFDLLRSRLDDRSDGFAAGLTATDATLSPGVVRRLACDAEIIPAVLGGRSEILDLGRAVRLVSPGQRRALALRDLHCSYPGCSVPATWCDAHHLVNWARGGRSDLTNYALLCARHHTYVHDRDLSGSIDPTAPPGLAVRWHGEVVPTRPCSRAPDRLVPR